MAILIVIGMAVIVFIAGILLIVKGTSSDEPTVVPISNLEEISGLKEVYATGKTEEKPSGAKPMAEPEGISQQAELDQLGEENKQLTDEIRRQKDELEHLKESVETIKKGEHHLAVQVERRERQVSELQADLKTFREISERKLNTAQETIHQLKSQAVEVRKSELEALSNKLVEAITVIEDLKRMNKNFEQANWDLKSDFKTTKELNAHLLEKERRMQYELTKNRAQALGLEKICEDFKTQIETMTAGVAVQ